MVFHCIIIEEEPKKVELFLTLREMMDRIEILESESKFLSITSAEI